MSYRYTVTVKSTGQKPKIFQIFGNNEYQEALHKLAQEHTLSGEYSEELKEFSVCLDSRGVTELCKVVDTICEDWLLNQKEDVILNVSEIVRKYVPEMLFSDKVAQIASGDFFYTQGYKLYEFLLKSKAVSVKVTDSYPELTVNDEYSVEFSYK